MIFVGVQWRRYTGWSRPSLSAYDLMARFHMVQLVHFPFIYICTICMLYDKFFLSLIFVAPAGIVRHRRPVFRPPVHPTTIPLTLAISAIIIARTFKPWIVFLIDILTQHAPYLYQWPWPIFYAPVTLINFAQVRHCLPRNSCYFLCLTQVPSGLYYFNS